MTSTKPNVRRMALVSAIPISGAILNGFFNGPLFRIYPFAYWIVDLLIYVIAPLAIAFWLAKSSGIRPNMYGLQFPPYGGAEAIATSIFFAFILLAAYGVAQYIGLIFTPESDTKPDFSYGAITPNGLLRPVCVLYWSLTAGFMESVFYIGLPWYFWSRKLGFASHRQPFLWASSFVFALAHWEQGLPNMCGAFAFGFLACLLYWRINDLWPIVGAHTLIDIILLQ